MVLLITGCGHGLGLEMLKLYSERSDFKIIGTARKGSIDDLMETFESKPNVEIIELDLLHPETFPDIVHSIISKYKRIDVLINNAAISYRAVLEHVEDENEKILMQTNYFGPRELIRLVVPYMKRNHKGKIINISSVGGMMAMPTMSSYSASKFALEGMSESLWYELKPFGVKVVLIQIGFVNSTSFKRVIISEKAKKLKNTDIYKYYYEGMSKFVERIMRLTPSSPKKIARKILLKAILHRCPKLRIPVTVDAYFFSMLRRWLPQRLYHFILYHMLPCSFKIKIREFIKYLETL